MDFVRYVLLMAVGLTTARADEIRARCGPNVLVTHRVTVFDVLRRQLDNPLLLLLLVAAVLSIATGSVADGVIISVIVSLSIGLGFTNEYRSERRMAALHLRVQHTALVWRDGRAQEIPATDLVPGDVVEVRIGSLVPTDGDLIDATDLEIDESMLTGESLPVVKTCGGRADSTSWNPANHVLMGSIVHAGSGRFTVTRTGISTEFGAVVRTLGQRQVTTRFQSGLTDFSRLLSKVAAVLMTITFAVNVAFHRPVLEAFLFCLSIAIGMTPQLLPAIVSLSLSAGSHRLAQRRVLVKRLVTIEDLGNVGLLFTDKTGTITQGHIDFSSAVDVAGDPSKLILGYGLLCNEAVVDSSGRAEGSTLDVATWQAPAASPELVADFTTLDILPFDHVRRMTSVLVRDGDGNTLMITKGAPESVLALCNPPEPTDDVLTGLFAEGMRVIAVAAKSIQTESLSKSDEVGLNLVGFLTFFDRPRPDAGDAIRRLGGLGITVKIVTGDNGDVAKKVCHDIGVEVIGVLTDTDIAAMTDEDLSAAIPKTTIFSRISPSQKARIITVARGNGVDVAFLGDGVNDAAALHAADVGISVDSAVDVAKEAADIVLLDKSLAVLADGVVEGRRIFSNTLKYVLMVTSSNFGNMFSAAGASFFLTFLPLLPGQVLLNNLLYDVGQLAIPLDAVDDEVLRRPTAWDISFVRRFMMTFGPISSLFDFATFWVMLSVLDAGNAEFRSGWFIESLATQTLVVYVIRTRRVPFFRSKPGAPMRVVPPVAALAGAIVPFTPIGERLGFTGLPLRFFAILVVMILLYLLLVELGKTLFYARIGRPIAADITEHQLAHRHIHRRAHRFVKHEGPGPTAVPS